MGAAFGNEGAESPAELAAGVAFGNKGAESPSKPAARAAEARVASAKEAAATATATKSTGRTTTAGGRDGDLAEGGHALGSKRGRALAEKCVSKECRGVAY